MVSSAVLTGLSSTSANGLALDEFFNLQRLAPWDAFESKYYTESLLKNNELLRNEHFHCN